MFTSSWLWSNRAWKLSSQSRGCGCAKTPILLTVFGIIIYASDTSVSDMSTVPIVAVGKKWRTKMGQPCSLNNRQTPYSNYLEVAGGLSAVNAFSTQLCDRIDLGLTHGGRCCCCCILHINRSGLNHTQ